MNESLEFWVRKERKKNKWVESLDYNRRGNNPKQNSNKDCVIAPPMRDERMGEKGEEKEQVILGFRLQEEKK